MQSTRRWFNERCANTTQDAVAVVNALPHGRGVPDGKRMTDACARRDVVDRLDPKRRMKDLTTWPPNGGQANVRKHIDDCKVAADVLDLSVWIALGVSCPSLPAARITSADECLSMAAQVADVATRVDERDVTKTTAILKEKESRMRASGAVNLATSFTDCPPSRTQLKYSQDVIAEVETNAANAGVSTQTEQAGVARVDPATALVAARYVGHSLPRRGPDDPLVALRSSPAPAGQHRIPPALPPSGA